MTDGHTSFSRVWRFAYVPVLALSMALLMARLLMLAWLLPVSEFALYNAGLLVSMTLGLMGSLGLYPLLQREMPIYFARAQGGRARHLLSRAIHASAVLAMLGVLLSPLASLASADGWIMAAGVINGFSQQLFLLACTESRSRGQPMRYTWQNLVRSTLLTAASITAAAHSATGLAVLLAEALVSAAAAIWLLRRSLSRQALRRVLSPWTFERALWRTQWKAALALLFASLAASALLYADRWVAALLLDRHGFALYSFSITVLLVAQSVQSMLNASIFPDISRTFATDGRKAAFAAASAWSVKLCLVGLALCAPVLWLLSEAVPRWFPAYHEAVAILPALTIAAVFRVSDFWSGFLVAVRAEAQLLRTQLAVGIGSTLLWTCGYIMFDSPALSAVAWFALMLSASWYFSAAVASWRQRLT
ncbi:MAG: hypothetical protein Fur0019_14770 [Tibeticola sp.]